jgi:hypothetical protein
MRFSAAILFTAIYLFSFTEMHELVRLPNLFRHYQEHITQSSEVGFVDFLLAHYGGAAHNGDHDHQNLPFDPAHGGAHSGHPAPVSLTEPFQTQFRRPSEALSHKSQEPRSRINSEYYLTIWQPPKA